MNACHLRWHPTKSPPILHRSRRGQFNLMTASLNQYHPQELYYRSRHLCHKETFNAIQAFVLALWQLRNTTNTVLVAQLLQAQKSNIISREDIIDQLRWCIQNCDKRFQLSWPSVKYLFIYTHTHTHYCLFIYTDFLCRC